MESVRSYIYAVFIVAMIAGIVNVLSSGSGSRGLEKNVRYICSLAVTVTLLYPLKCAFSDIDFSFSLPDTSKSTVDTELAVSAIINMTEDRICKELENAVKEKYGEEDVSVTLELDASDPGNVIIETVYLKIGSHEAEAVSYLEEISGCKVALVSGEGDG